MRAKPQTHQKTISLQGVRNAGPVAWFVRQRSAQ
jgi:hypothetical protein